MEIMESHFGVAVVMLQYVGLSVDDE